MILSRFSRYRPRHPLTHALKPILPKSTRAAHMDPKKKRLLVLDAFCLRNFDKEASTSNFIDYDTEAFEAHVNQALEEAGGLSALKPGYAPFCKHFFIANFTPATAGAVTITDSNRHLLETRYHARTDKELPVLERYFPAGTIDAPPAKYLDLILYSREQIEQENKEMGQPTADTDAPYGIISIKPQNVDHEQPMNPITQMRNALGKDQGGSGVPLTREKYLESVAFWTNHAVII